jgi:hypothetical protein
MLAILVVCRKQETMSSLRSLVDGIADWTAANVRAFSYLLPDTVELALYLCLAVYFAIQLQQQA